MYDYYKKNSDFYYLSILIIVPLIINGGLIKAFFGWLFILLYMALIINKDSRVNVIPVIILLLYRSIFTLIDVIDMGFLSYLSNLFTFKFTFFLYYPSYFIEIIALFICIIFLIKKNMTYRLMSIISLILVVVIYCLKIIYISQNNEYFVLILLYISMLFYIIDIKLEINHKIFLNPMYLSAILMGSGIALSIIALLQTDNLLVFLIIIFCFILTSIPIKNKIYNKIIFITLILFLLFILYTLIYGIFPKNEYQVIYKYSPPFFNKPLIIILSITALNILYITNINKSIRNVLKYAIIVGIILLSLSTLIIIGNIANGSNDIEVFYYHMIIYACLFGSFLKINEKNEKYI